MRLFFVFLGLALSIQSALAADTASVTDAASAPTQSISASAAAPTPETEAPRLVCHQESDIGSMRMHKVCTRVQTDSERLQLQDTLKNSLPNSSLAHAAPGAGH